jgi:acetyl esterase/lipase
VPAHAAPARARDLVGLPPTFISVGALDGFRDEDVEFATRLNQAGVPTDLHVHAGAPHGFHMFAGTTLADRANDHLDQWLAGQLTRSATAPSADQEDALR